MRARFPAKLVLLGAAAGIAGGVISFIGGGPALALGLLGLIWASLTYSRPDITLAALILVLPLRGSTTLVSLPAIPDVTLARILVVWSLVVIAMAVRSQRRHDDDDSDDESESILVERALPIWIGILLAFMLLAALRSPDVVTGLQNWMDAYLAPLGLLYAVTRYRWSRRETDTVVVAFLAACCLWSAFGLFEAATQRSLFAEGGELGFASGGDPFGRTGGPFVNPAFLGTAAGIGLVLARVWSSRTDIDRRVALACIPLSLIGLVVSLTRASWLAAAAGTLVIMALARQSRVAITLIATSAVVVGLLLIISMSGTAPLENRAGSTSEVFNRVVVQRAALQIIAENPLVGVGSERFAALSRDEIRNVGSISGSFGIGTLVPHNSILNSTVDGGLGAGASLIVVMGLLMVAAKRLAARTQEHYLGTAALAAVVVLCINGMFIDMALATNVTTLAFTVTGVLLSTQLDEPPSEP